MGSGLDLGVVLVLGHSSGTGPGPGYCFAPQVIGSDLGTALVLVLGLGNRANDHLDRQEGRQNEDCEEDSDYPHGHLRLERQLGLAGDLKVGQSHVVGQPHVIGQAQDRSEAQERLQGALALRLLVGKEGGMLVWAETELHVLVLAVLETAGAMAVLLVGGAGEALAQATAIAYFLLVVALVGPQTLAKSNLLVAAAIVARALARARLGGGGNRGSGTGEGLLVRGGNRGSGTGGRSLGGGGNRGSGTVVALTQSLLGAFDDDPAFSAAQSTGFCTFSACKGFLGCVQNKKTWKTYLSQRIKKIIFGWQQGAPRGGPGEPRGKPGGPGHPGRARATQGKASGLPGSPGKCTLSQ